MKIIVTLLTMFSSLTVFSQFQDTIVTIKNDTIPCRVTLQNPRYIYYEDASFASFIGIFKRIDVQEVKTLFVDDTLISMQQTIVINTDTTTKKDAVIQQINQKERQKQKMAFHLDAGMNIGYLAVENNHFKSIPRIGYNAGFYFDIPIGEQLYFETGVQYSQHGGTFLRNTDPSVGVYYQKEVIELDLLQFPFLIKTITQNKWFAVGGLSFSGIINYKDHWEIKDRFLTSNSYIDRTVFGIQNDLAKHPWGLSKVELGGIIKLGKYFENGFGIGVEYQTSVLGNWRKQTFLPIDEEYYWFLFTNNAIGIDLTYKFGKKN